MVREDLIEGAITFLQDPSVSNAPLEQKVSFLRSKNLTQEEIDASLARVGQSPTVQIAPQQSSYPQQYRQQPPQHGGYQQQPYWGQPPPEVPRRDWRDWFIMATVMGGAGYAMYWTAKRYIYPLIAPPTPPQLEQDKASIDASFDKAFALLDQLATDTQELKDAEAARKERLDSALAEVEGVIAKMKEANENREHEAKRMAREIEEIKDQIPQAIAKEKETTDGRLKDLSIEMKSLKTLVANRMGQQPQSRPSSFPPAVNGTSGSASPAPAAPAPETNGANGMADEGEKAQAQAQTQAQPQTASILPDRSSTSSPYGRMLGGKAQIPQWQLAAKKRNEEAKKEPSNSSAPDLSESGTVADAEAGA